MIPETGHFALILALMFALAAATLPLIGAARGDDRLIALARPLALGQFLLILTAFLALAHAYATSDFSVLNVAENSHSLKPMLYKLSGTWGNHEGSLLLWVLILTLFSSLVAFGARSIDDAFRARILAVQAMIASGFLLFMLLTSNPFLRLLPAPLEGRGLNPLLQDPGLAFHPPFLYLGYVGFSVAFSFAVAALIEGRIGPAWARAVRPWALGAWTALTLGIALGSWWAYYELGWGGWWFWDPVENASFMPWLAGTALVHSAIVVEKRDALKRWTVLLAILTFSLSLLGTFLVRSGVLTSVHAFAVDPERGVFILLLLGIAIGGALALYALRAGALEPGGLFRPASREGALVLNNVLLSIACAIVFVGTLYPLILDALTGDKVTVGPPFFEASFTPVMALLVLALGFGPLLAWKRGDLVRAAIRLRFALSLAAALAALAFVLWGAGPVMAFLGFALGGWLIGAGLVDLVARSGLPATSPRQAFARLRGLPRATFAMILAHMGLGITIFGISASEAWTDETLTVLAIGETAEVGDYRFRLEGVEPVAGPNYTAIRARFAVSRNGREHAPLLPEQRSYSAPPMETTEAAIAPHIGGDLYAVIGDPTSDGRWSARLYFKPLVSWIWGGALVMALGGILSLSDRRLRIGAPRRTGSRPAAPAPLAAE
ncbi:MAG: heme lyase CcmF/NrfE family subunit [Rhodothalassiaceae bacterium]